MNTNFDSTSPTPSSSATPVFSKNRNDANTLVRPSTESQGKAEGSASNAPRDWKLYLTDEAGEFLTSRIAAELIAEISPFELVSTALHLAKYYGGQKPPHAYFSDAREILCLGRYHLARAPVFSHLRILVASFEGPVTFTFDQILKPIPQAPNTWENARISKKGGPTMVGNITTEQGLIKALKRIYGPQWQSFIDHKQVRYKGKIHVERCLSQVVIDQIREDQLDRNRKKTLLARRNKSNSRRD